MGQPAEDLRIPEADEVTHSQEDRRLHQMRPGRMHRRRRRPPAQAGLHPQGEACRLHLHGIPRQDGRLRTDHLRRAQLLQAVRQVHQGPVRRLPEGGVRVFRQADHDDPGQGAPALGQDHPGDAQGAGQQGRARIPPAGLPGSQRVEEVRRQMKRAILDVTYTTLATMRDDITRWLASSVPMLDIERYLYRVV